VSEGLAGLIRLVNVEQCVAKENESGGVGGVLLGVRAEKRNGFGGLVLRAKMLGARKGRGGLSVGCGLQSCKDEWK
jgi:hypothetical protein